MKYKIKRVIKKEKFIYIKKFSNFHKFRSFYLPIFSQFGVFKPKDIERTIRVCYAQSLGVARYLTEEKFVKLFDYSQKMEEFLKKIDAKTECENNRTETLNSMSKPNLVKLDTTRVKRVLHSMSRHLVLMGHKFKRTSFTEATTFMPKNTSSSFPDYITPKSQNFDNVINQNRNRNDTEEFRFMKESLIGTQWRTQINRSNKLKFRQFYPLPHYIQVLERSLFNGFFIHFDKYKETPYAYSNIWPHLRKRYISCQNYKYTYSLDIKGFDMNVSNDIIRIIFDWMYTFLVLDAQGERDFQKLLDYHLNAKILLSSERQTITFQKERGLLSGSTLTNMLGSLVSMFCLQYFYLDTTGVLLNSKQLTLHGDDNILSTDKKFSLDFISEYFLKTFGSVISIEKSEIFTKGQKIYFLGHYIDENGRYLNKDRMIHQLCFGSHYISKDIMSSSERVFSKLCSLLFKCTDGWETFLGMKDKLLEILDLNELPNYYLDFAHIGGEISKRKFDEVRDQWMKS